MEIKYDLRCLVQYKLLFYDEYSEGDISFIEITDKDLI